MLNQTDMVVVELESLENPDANNQITNGILIIKH